MSELRSLFRRIATALVLGICLAIPCSVAAEGQTRLTVRNLAELCAAADATRQSLCRGYIAGVRQTMDVFKHTLKQRVRYCVPREVTNRQVRASFLAWVNRNGAAAAQPAIVGVIRSIHESYPCRPGGQFEL